MQTKCLHEDDMICNPMEVIQTNIPINTGLTTPKNTTNSSKKEYFFSERAYAQEPYITTVLLKTKLKLPV